jgi:hypothetical protein
MLPIILLGDAADAQSKCNPEPGSRPSASRLSHWVQPVELRLGGKKGSALQQYAN